MNKLRLLKIIIHDACDNYFTEIYPKKIKIKITHNYKWKGARKIAGVWSWKPLTIHFDDEWLENTNILSILEVVIHELMHVQLYMQKKPQPKTSQEEYKLNTQVNRILQKLRKENADLIHRLEQT